jgi:hypothetical protein
MMHGRGKHMIAKSEIDLNTEPPPLPRVSGYVKRKE